MRLRLSRSTWLVASLCLWLFLLPSNAFIKLAENQAYVHGLLVDYLIPKFYLSDVAAVLLLVTTFTRPTKPWRVKFSKTAISAIALIVLLSLRQANTEHALAGIWYTWHLLLVGLLGLKLWSQPALLKTKAVLATVWLTCLFQISVAWYQFLTQKALFGYWFLGEPDLQRGLGIATAVFNGAERIVPYGTTAHPNVLSGLLAIYLLVSLLIYQQLPKLSRWWQIMGMILAVGVVSVILVTQAWAALATLLIGSLGLVIYRTGKLTSEWQPLAGLALAICFIFGPLLIHFGATYLPRNPSFSRRDFLNQAAVHIWSSQPIWGSGLNQTTTIIEAFSPTMEVVRFVQPIHHLGLLWLSETGLVGIAFIGLMVYLTRKTHLLFVWLVLAPIMVSDHYLLTLATGQGLLLLSWWSSRLLEVPDRL